MTSTDFSTRLYLSSVQLNRLDDMQKPAGFASGCLIDYFGKRVLLTVAHAAGKQGNWAMQVKYVPGMGTQNQPLGSMHFLAKASLTDPTLREVDFSYAEIPATVLPYRQEIESKDVITREAPITVHRTTLEDNPHSASTYGFAEWFWADMKFILETCMWEARYVSTQGLPIREQRVTIMSSRCRLSIPATSISRDAAVHRS
jgi:hypothetical protein